MYLSIVGGSQSLAIRPKEIGVVSWALASITVASWHAGSIVKTRVRFTRPWLYLVCGTLATSLSPGIHTDKRSSICVYSNQVIANLKS
jgi:hypothetical protein